MDEQALDLYNLDRILYCIKTKRMFETIRIHNLDETGAYKRLGLQYIKIERIFKDEYLPSPIVQIREDQYGFIYKEFKKGDVICFRTFLTDGRYYTVPSQLFLLPWSEDIFEPSYLFLEKVLHVSRRSYVRILPYFEEIIKDLEKILGMIQLLQNLKIKIRFEVPKQIENDIPIQSFFEAKYQSPG